MKTVKIVTMAGAYAQKARKQWACNTSLPTRYKTRNSRAATTSAMVAAVGVKRSFKCCHVAVQVTLYRTTPVEKSSRRMGGNWYIM